MTYGLKQAKLSVLPTSKATTFLKIFAIQVKSQNRCWQIIRDCKKSLTIWNQFVNLVFNGKGIEHRQFHEFKFLKVYGSFKHNPYLWVNDNRMGRIDKEGYFYLQVKQ